jgi:hypothetical protein
VSEPEEGTTRYSGILEVFGDGLCRPIGEPDGSSLIVSGWYSFELISGFSSKAEQFQTTLSGDIIWGNSF